MRALVTIVVLAIFGFYGYEYAVHGRTPSEALTYQAENIHSAKSIKLQLLDD